MPEQNIERITVTGQRITLSLWEMPGPHWDDIFGEHRLYYRVDQTIHDVPTLPRFAPPSPPENPEKKSAIKQFLANASEVIKGLWVDLIKSMIEGSTVDAYIWRSTKIYPDGTREEMTFGELHACINSDACVQSESVQKKQGDLLKSLQRQQLHHRGEFLQTILYSSFYDIQAKRLDSRTVDPNGAAQILYQTVLGREPNEFEIGGAAILLLRSSMEEIISLLEYIGPVIKMWRTLKTETFARHAHFKSFPNAGELIEYATRLKEGTRISTVRGEILEVFLPPFSPGDPPDEVLA